jgi:hypothetical protein
MFSEEVFGDRTIDTYSDYSQNELFLSQIAISRDGPSVDLPPAVGVNLIVSLSRWRMEIKVPNDPNVGGIGLCMLQSGMQNDWRRLMTAVYIP